MGGKSNKFDYTNRSNSGAKLGQIIGSALQKEAEKVKKDAERHLQKARKQSSDSGSGLAPDLSAATSTTHVIDLKAPGKELGDDGVCALLDGLEIGLRSGTPEASLALEDLNLCGNGITTASLARLAPVIELAKYDLKTLNLADNKIRVVADQEAAQWETFLRGFRGCMKLRRLDLSNNVELGCRAMEVLARVHIAEPHVTPAPPGGEVSTLSLISERNGGMDNDQPVGVEGADALGIELNQGMADGQLMKRRCGLRSIPFITLHNVGLDDSGALWLSYLIETHYYPNQLVDELNATQLDSPVRAYQQDANMLGVDWTVNVTLGKEGTHLLERTEILRRQTMLDDSATLASSFLDDIDGVDAGGEGHRRKSTESKQLKSTPQHRRVSIRSIRTADGGEHETSELDSARKKLKRAIIAHDGASGVELWHSALRVVRISRLLLYLAPWTRTLYTGPPLFNFPEAIEPPSPPSPKPVDSPANEVKGLVFKAPTYPPATSQATYASKLQAEHVLTDVTNTPATPMILQRPGHRKGAFSEGSDLSTITDKLNDLATRDRDRDRDPRRFIKYQEDRLKKVAEEGIELRDEGVACQLPPYVMQLVIRRLMTEREMGVMSERQMRAAMEWGQRRETLTTEREWLRKDESTQILMLLDSIGCLAYEQ